MAKTEIVANPGVPQILMTREFAASAEALFRAHTDPALLARWLGPRDMTMEIERLEVRDGGRWRYINREASGTAHAFHGVFHGTPSAEGGIVQTFEYEGTPGHVAMETLTFEEREGRTTVRTNSVFQTVGARDAMIASGMEHGVNDGYDRLDELVADGALGD